VLRDQAVHLLLDPDIGQERDCPDAHRSSFGGHAIGLFPVCPGVHDDVGRTAGQLEHGGSAQVAALAGKERHLSVHPRTLPRCLAGRTVDGQAGRSSTVRDQEAA